MNRHKIKLETKTTGKLSLVKTIKEISGLGLKEAKWFVDSLLEIPLNKWIKLNQLDVHGDDVNNFGDKLLRHQKDLDENFGIIIKDNYRDKLTIILDGKIIMDDTIDKYKKFIDSIDEKDEVALDIFKNLLPLLKEHPFDVKDSVREFKKVLEETKQ